MYPARGGFYGISRVFTLCSRDRLNDVVFGVARGYRAIEAGFVSKKILSHRFGAPIEDIETDCLLSCVIGMQGYQRMCVNVGPYGQPPMYVQTVGST